ncbi:MAG: outer membrane beta-barrel family protein [Dysgonamonadaceae bacterium]
MKRFILVILVMQGFIISVFSQTKSGKDSLASIKGEIVDSLSGKPEAYATIQVVKQSTPHILYKSYATDGKGKFQISLPYPGKYALTFVAFEKELKKAMLELTSKAETDMGAIRLKGKSIQLKEVEVVAAKPLIKTEMDRFSYNLENDPDSKTSTLLEMVNKVPMLSVDNDQNLKLKGGTKFKILMDGKETNMSGEDLKNMMKATQANAIKEIQVITDPGAKYESEGLDGLINIITYKNSKLGGYVINLNTGVDHYGGYNGGISSQIKYGKLGVNASLSRNSSRQPESHYDSYREALNDDSNKYLTSTGKSKYNGSSNYASVRLNYEIDTLRLLSVNGSTNQYEGNNTSSSETSMLNASNIPQFQYTSSGNSNYNNKYANLDINYQRTSAHNKDRLFTFSYQLNTRPANNESQSAIEEVLNYKGYNSRSNSDLSFLNHSLQADFTTPIHKVHVIETGIKYQVRIDKSKTLFGFYYPLGSGKQDSTRTDRFRNEQDIFSAYASYRYTLGKKWSFRAGLRLENTEQSIKYPNHEERNFNKSYLTLVPSSTISYKINDMQTLRVNYRMGLWRPNIWTLNPYNTSTDTLYVRVGNPDLTPEKYHTFGLNYDANIKKVFIGLNLNYSFSNNSIYEIAELRNKVTYTTYNNIGKERRTNAWLSFSWNPNANFRLSTNGGVTYSYYETGGTLDQKNDGVSYNVNFDCNYTAPLKIRIGVNSYYSSPWISTQGKGSGYSYYAANISRNFLPKDRFTIRLYANNPFAGDRRYKNTTETTTFRSIDNNYYPQSRYGISLSLRIGDMKVQIKETRRGISNDDIKSSGGGQ